MDVPVDKSGECRVVLMDVPVDKSGEFINHLHHSSR